jgi:hypothetical protein
MRLTWRRVHPEDNPNLSGAVRWRHCDFLGDVFITPKGPGLIETLPTLIASSESRLLQKARRTIAEWEADRIGFQGEALLEVTPLPHNLALPVT